jgi:DNA sulfur modification protein DndB
MATTKKATTAKAKDPYVHEFPAMRGVMAGREFYSCIVPIRVLTKIFLFDEEEVPVELRVQRTLNPKRADDIRDYVIDNPKDYVLPSLTASVDGELEFVPISDEGDLRKLGVLRVAIASRFILNDGQHRKAGLTKALQENPQLAYESVNVLFFLDIGLKRCQQIFSDINRNMKIPDAAINITFDHRDAIAVMTREVIKEIPFLRQFVQQAGGTIKAKSNKLLVVTWVYKANQRISAVMASGQQEFCLKFWEALIANTPKWQEVLNQEISAEVLRRDYICCTAIAIEAFSHLGVALAQNPTYIEHPEKMLDKLASLATVDWWKQDKTWLGMVVDTNGRMLTKKENIQLLVQHLSQITGVRA